MSALAIILTAAMVIPGNVPERMAGEMERNPFAGKWEGKVECAEEKPLPMSMEDGQMSWDDWLCGDPFVKVAEGRLRWRDRTGEHLGIYREDDDRLIICLSRTGGDWPTFFGTEKNKLVLITFHRVKLRK